jgi:hypothetical protein
MKFSVSLQIEVDEKGNILAVDEDGWEQDVEDLLEHLFYDVDDVKINTIKVKR